MPSSSTRRSKAFAFPYTKYDDTKALYANFRYLQQHLSTLGNAINPGAFDLVVAADDSPDADRADLVVSGSQDGIAIQNAMQEHGGPTGCSVFLLSGSYRFDTGFNFNETDTDNSLICGSGDSTIINYYGTGYAIESSTDNSKRIFRDFKLVDQTANATIGIGATDTSSYQEILIQNVSVYNFDTGFLNGRTDGEFQVNDCTIFNCVTGISGDRDGTFRIYNNFIEDCTTGIYSDQAEQIVSGNFFKGGTTGYNGGGGDYRTLTMSGNTFWQVAGTNIALSGQGDNPATITGNSFRDGGRGVVMSNWFGNISPVAIVGNTFNNMTEAYDTSIKNAASVYKGNVFDGTTPIISEVDTVAALDDIGDVTITTIASGEILKWNGTAWINNTLAEAAISDTSHAHSYNIEDLSNVTITTIADNELLQWDTAGATWENRTIAEAGLSEVGHTHAAGGAGLQDILMLGGM